MGDHASEDTTSIIWRMTCYVKQLKKVNYSIVVELKVANSELKQLRKAECDLQRMKLTTFVKNNLQIVKDPVTRKIGIEVSRKAKAQKVAVETVAVEKCFSAEEHRRIDHWEQRNK